MFKIHTIIWQSKYKSPEQEYQKFKTDTNIIKRTSPIQEIVPQKPGVESKIKGIPSVSAKAGSNLNTVSMTPTLEENIKNVESKIKGIPTVSAKAGLNLNTVSMTQTRKNNTGGESKIKGVPSVSVKADSNLNTVSMTPTLKLKNTKEVPLQLPGTSQQINGHFTSPEAPEVAKTNKLYLSCQKRAIWNKNIL